MSLPLAWSILLTDNGITLFEAVEVIPFGNDKTIKIGANDSFDFVHVCVCRIVIDRNHQLDCVCSVDRFMLPRDWLNSKKPYI